MSATCLIKEKHTKSYQCNMCDFKSAKASRLKLHLRSHAGEKLESCVSYLKQCFKTHIGEGSSLSSTDEPSELSDNKSEAITVLRKPRKTSTIHACKMCDYKSGRPFMLKRHERTHTGEKPYMCNMCDYKSAFSSGLKRHTRTHTGEKRHACTICDYTCEAANDLTLHIRRHTGEKPFQCNLCDYKTVQASHLKKHERMHTGEKPYECNMCGYRFTLSSQLTQHVKRSCRIQSDYIQLPMDLSITIRK